MRIATLFRQACFGAVLAVVFSCSDEGVEDQPIKAEGTQLSVMFLPQQCQSWCWAAGIAMVANYVGSYVQECELARAKTGFECCYYGCYGYCNQTAQSNEIDGLLAQANVAHDYQAGPLSEHQLQVELSSDRPVLAGFQGPFAGHVAVITGFTPGYVTTYRIYDPWYGIIDAPYSGLLSGPGFGEPWIHSYFRIHKYDPGGCE